MMLERIRADCAFAKAGGDTDFSPREFALSSDRRNEIARALSFAQGQLQNIGLITSALALRDASTHIAAVMQWQITNRQCKDRIEELERVITSEMQSHSFVHLAQSRVAYYGQDFLFGLDVATKFPSASFDIKEAGNCLALSRATACVFHLMRVLEIVLGAMGKKFGVSLAHTNWAPAIEQIESKIRDIHKDPTWKALPDCKEQQEFFAQGASHFGILKDAWRNYTMHSRGKYTEEEAEQILSNVRAFTKKLAERISE